MLPNGITIVFSSRKIDPDYINHIKKTCGVYHCEILSCENNRNRSLANVYNEGLNNATHDLVVFIHDDLIFETRNWGNKLFKHFKRNPDYGIIGIAGTNHLVDGRWWTVRENMHGIVKHTDGTKVWVNKFSPHQNNHIKPMVVLDGLFIAVDKTKIKYNFDEEFNGFHFYDIPFCLNNHLVDVKIGVVTDIIVIHKSVGQTNGEWENNKQLFETKYKDKLPIKI